MSINREQAEHHADAAEVAHADLQGQLMAPDPDRPRIESLRAAAEYHNAAALSYAALALVDALTADPPQVTATSPTDPDLLAATLARQLRRQRRRDGKVGL